jgi:tetratricopeptide (TPR) repeat protein
MGLIRIPAQSREAGAVMAIEGEKLERLHGFLQGSFLPSELHMFLTFLGGDFAAVATTHHPQVLGASYVFEIIGALERKCLINSAFFDRLREKFPARGAEITRLAESCLGADPTSSKGPGSPAKSCNLPLVTIGPLFKGREAFLDDLRRRLGARDGRATAIVGRQAIHGLGGVGKTRAAVEYARRHAGGYTALLFVFAATPAGLQANLANLVGVLGMTAGVTSVDEQLAAVLRWLDAHPGWLLILDGVDTEEAAREVERLVARLQAGHVLITSRITNWSPAVEPLELDVLVKADAVAFLLERPPHRRRQPDDESEAEKIAGELGGLALALEQAGAYIDKRRLSFAEYLRCWQEKRAELLRWHDERLMQCPASVAVTWETTFAQLAEPERRLLEVLSWLAPEPIPLFVFGAAPLVKAIPDPREALAGLAGYSLARFDASGEAVLVHRLVQEITRGRIAAVDRTAALETALRAVNDLAPGEALDVRTWGVWTPLAAHAEAVSRYADEAGLAQPTSRLMDRLASYRQARGQFRAAEPLYRRALAISERSYGPDHPDVATHLNNLALLLGDTNRLGEAEPLYRRALAIDERSYGPDHPTGAIRLNNLAGLLGATNRLGEAEPLFRRALAIAEQSYGPDHPTVATALNNLAGLLGATNRLGEAEPLFRRALAIAEQSYGPDHPDVARDLNNLALLLGATNRPGEAEPLYRRVVAIFEASLGPDHPNVAAALNNLAGLLGATNRLGEAEPLFRRALQILIEFQRRTGHEHPNLRVGGANYLRLLEALGKTPDQIKQQWDELTRPPHSEGT